MISIDENYRIGISYLNKNSNLRQNVVLKIYNKSNVLNGSWKWLNDDRVTALMDKGQKKNTLEDQLAYLKKITNSKEDILFAIYFNKKHIGNVGLHQISLEKKTAQFGILIGNTNYHNKGIGKHVWLAIIEFAFYELKIRKIYTMIVANNIASKKIAENLGFKKMKKKYFLVKNGNIFDYPKYYVTPKLLRKEVL